MLIIPFTGTVFNGEKTMMQVGVETGVGTVFNLAAGKGIKVLTPRIGDGGASYMNYLSGNLLGNYTAPYILSETQKKPNGTTH